MYSITIANNCTLFCPTQSPIYVVSTPNNGSYSITRVYLDYCRITKFIAKLLTAPIVQCC